MEERASPAFGPVTRFHPVLAVVVPVRNEELNILPLIREIETALQSLAFEIVYVDDGSDDATGLRLREAKRSARSLRVLRHRRSSGQSAAILSGVKAATADWIATLDGDGQNDPADIPALFQRALALDAECAAGVGPVLITGERRRRMDSWGKRMSSRIANTLRARLLRDGTPDTGCGLKVFRKDAFLALPHFDHMHRFLPALFIRAGGSVVSVPVAHRPRLRGRSNYGTLDRLWVGLADLAGVFWLQRRRIRAEPEDATIEPAPPR
ncbi:MAG: glycosyltransferase family 2 protein [Acetobacteraceae bacterium]|nr:glycosyltransferase family 2 protein [Acetobacteraceae bacterium]